MGKLKIDRAIVEETLEMADSLLLLKDASRDRKDELPSLSVDLIDAQHMSEILNLATYVSEWMNMDIITEINEEEGRFKIFLAS